MSVLTRMRLVALCLWVCAPAAFAADNGLEQLPFVKKMQLAKAGDPDAKMAVAQALESGIDTKTNPALAAKWYREAALTGNYEAQYRLAKLVDKGAPGLKSDKPTAIKLLDSAAKHGHAPSQNLLGQMLQNGDGMAKDEKAAVEWYKKAAAQKLAVAQNNLGVMLLKGLGTDRNLDEAFKMFDLAAQGEDGWAMNNLGGMYEMGWGTKKDLDKAKEFYQKAADKGIVISTKNLMRIANLSSAPAPASTTAAAPKP
jgi:uncharacterized protein